MKHKPHKNTKSHKNRHKYIIYACTFVKYRELDNWELFVLFLYEKQVAEMLGSWLLIFVEEKGLIYSKKYIRKLRNDTPTRDIQAYK